MRCQGSLKSPRELMLIFSRKPSLSTFCKPFNGPRAGRHPRRAERVTGGPDGSRPYARVRARGQAIRPPPMASAGQLSIKELTPARPLRYGHPQAREGERVDPGPLGRGGAARRRSDDGYHPTGWRRRWRSVRGAMLMRESGRAFIKLKRLHSAYTARGNKMAASRNGTSTNLSNSSCTRLSGGCARAHRAASRVRSSPLA
jgi:hypothetical protein